MALALSSLPLSKVCVRQLEKCDAKARRSGAPLSKLQSCLMDRHFCPEQGLYVPISADLYLVNKLPVLGRPNNGSCFLPHVPFFSNALLIPADFGQPGFDPARATPPTLRLANNGVQVVTLEIDCERRQQLEEMLGWVRGKKPLIAELDTELSQVKEYRGYTAVFSGNRSIHFHFIYASDHLINAPATSGVAERLAAADEVAALMNSVHRLYFDHVAEHFTRIMKPPKTIDPSLRSPTQWRRMPGGIRTLTAKDDLLRLPAGSQVPQLVLAEHLRSRAAIGSSELVPKNHSISHPIKLRHGRDSTAKLSNPTLLLARIAEELHSEWGQSYPRPVSAARDKQGEWIITFQNHAHDRHSSTICKGDHRTLLFAGTNNFTKTLFLPDRMTAQQFCDHLELSTVGVSTRIIPTVTQATSTRTGTPTNWYIKALTDRLYAAGSALKDPAHLAAAYRSAFPPIIDDVRSLGLPYIIKSGEGVGKNYAHFRSVADAALDASMANESDVLRFHCFASRSRDQARQKAEEFRRCCSGHHPIVVHGFRHHYEQCCADLGVTPIPKSSFRSGSLDGILAAIKRTQPAVYNRLETVRKSLWQTAGGNIRPNDGTWIVFTTQALARTFNYGQTTPLWYHPEFDPEQPGSYAAVRDRMKLINVVYDELETQDCLEILSQEMKAFVAEQQAAFPNWRSLPRAERQAQFTTLRRSGRIPVDGPTTFDELDAKMRISLCHLKEVRVDFDAIPYGFDRGESGLYKGENGKAFFLGIPSWLGLLKWGFLTTESLVTNILGKAFETRRKNLLRFDMDQLPGLYPIKIPLFIDKRASARGAASLAQEIMANDDNAVVISNHVSDMDRCINFQKVKGHNGLADKNIYIVLTCLSGRQYAELNVIGQWLEMPNIIELYYQDQIDQAVGRNRGFRQTPGTKCSVIVSNRLYQGVIADLSAKVCGRTLLYPDSKCPWPVQAR